MATKLFLGFDPGGENAFGWSICYEGNGGFLHRYQSSWANDALNAAEQVDDAVNSFGGAVRVLAAGIDAPLLWNSRGGRAVDQELRAALRINGFLEKSVNGTVQAVNSLQGSCVVQGALLVKHLNTQRWDQNLTIMESHPTAFRYLLSHIGQPEMARMAARMKAELATCNRVHQRKKEAKGCTTCKRDSHRQDATLCAIAAWAGSRAPRLPNWQNLYDLDNHLDNPFRIRVSYWMPIPG